MICPSPRSTLCLVVAALSVAKEVDPFQADLPEGTVIRAIDAVGWSKGHRNCDIRPRLVDKVTGEARLLDSGSQISRISDFMIHVSLQAIQNGKKCPLFY